MNKDEIKSKYKRLLEGKEISAQQRGFEFERLLNSVLENEKLEPRTGFKPKGEQVDGSFFWEGRTFLLEAKWVNHKIPVSYIYSFKGKLDGKFHNTSGVFLSMSDYSSDVEDALKFGKTLNILLFDRTDIEIIFNNEISFLEVLKFKLREAGDTGSLLVPYDTNKKVEEINNKEEYPKEIIERSHLQTVVEDILVFVEGEMDREFVRKVINLLSKKFTFSYKIVVLKGTHDIRLLPSLLNIYRKVKAAIVFIDGPVSHIENITKPIEDQINNSSNPRPISFFNFDRNLFDLFKRDIVKIEVLKENLTYRSLDNFFQSISDAYYDPERDIPIEILERAIKNFKWNYKLGQIETSDTETDQLHIIEDIDDLVEYLDEKIIQAMDGEMPLHWLKDNNPLDYETEVKEYLGEYYLEEIEKLGWDVSHF